MEEVSFSTNQFSNASAAPWHRFGDLLPLPLPSDCGYSGLARELSSRRARQRVVKRRVLCRREADTIRSLNRLAGFENEAHWPLSSQNFAQKSAMARVHLAHQQRAPPVIHESDKAALLQLLANKLPSSYGSSEAVGAVSVYQREMVSLPKDQTSPVQLEQLLPPLEAERVKSFEDRMLLGDEEMSAVLEKGLEGDMYVDPVLEASKKDYHAFVADLVRCQLVGFTSSPRVQVGIFFVSKKNGKLRMIIDARRTNKLFRKPPSTMLGSSDCWGRTEVSEKGPIFFAQEDVKDFFYRLGISKRLGEFFSLPKVDPQTLEGELGWLPEELADHRDGQIAMYPHLQVLPMGFSWAFHLAHECHVHLARQCLPSVACWWTEGKPPFWDGVREPVRVGC